MCFSRVKGYGCFWLVVTTSVIVVASVDALPLRSVLYPEDWSNAHTDGGGRFLHDYSYAGYQNGEVPLPDPSGLTIFDAVSGFGADNTGATDASTAIQAAIDTAAVAGGVVYLPAGTYRCDARLSVTASNTVLRGVGPDQTKLYFTTFADMTGRGHIELRGSVSRGPDILLAQDGLNRAFTVPITDASGLSVGDELSLGWVITDEFIAEHAMTGTWLVFNGQWKPMFRREISAIDMGSAPHTVTLSLPLRYPAKTRDSASLRTESGYLEECGIENLSLANAVDYQDAWSVARVHVVTLLDAKDCWIRNVHTSPSPLPEAAGYHLQSNGIRILSSKRITIADCDFQKAQNRGGGGCGYLYEISASNEVLLRDCIGRDGRHNFIQNWDFGTTGCVFLRCQSSGGRNFYSSSNPFSLVAYCEYHHSLTMACLVDSCVLDDGWYGGNRRTQSSGAGHTVTQSVYWNTSGTGRLRSWQYGNGYIVGTQDIEVYTALEPYGLALAYEGTEPEDYVEAIGQGDSLLPQSLYEDQKARRLGGTVEVACDDCTCYRDTFAAEWELLSTTLGFENERSNVPGNQIWERWSLALVRHVLCEDTLPWHLDVEAAYLDNLATLRTETQAVQDSVDGFEHAVAALTLVSSPTRDHMAGAFSLERVYQVFNSGAKDPAESLSGDGNLDEDGYTNAEEFENVLAQGGGMDDYAEAAADPESSGHGMPVGGGATALLIGALGGFLVWNRAKRPRTGAPLPLA